jgi:hypothetical protein
MLTKLPKVTQLILANSLFISLLGLAVLCAPAYEQEATSVAGRYVAQARNILRTLHPELNGKGYALSISTPIDYDHPDDASQNFQLDVGDRYKDLILGYAGGWRADKPKSKDFKPGPIHPKQYLTAVFIYTQAQLKSFGAWGSLVGNPDAEQALVEQVKVSNKRSTATEANAALKRAGANYGLEDKQAFVAALPIAKLEPFLGKLSITSVKLEGSDEDDDDVRASSWPNWTVLATAQQADRKVPVRMLFEPFKGDLISLIVDPGRQ